MYATVRRYTCRAGTVREVARIAESGFLPIARTIPGFVSYTIIEGGTDNGRDVLITVTTCQTAEGVEESVRKAATWVRNNVAQFDPSTPMVATGEVLTTTAAAQPQYAP